MLVLDGLSQQVENGLADAVLHRPRRDIAVMQDSPTSKLAPDDAERTLAGRTTSRFGSCARGFSPAVHFA
jgi:hypothetical protein